MFEVHENGMFLSPNQRASPQSAKSATNKHPKNGMFNFEQRISVQVTTTHWLSWNNLKVFWLFLAADLDFCVSVEIFALKNVILVHFQTCRFRALFCRQLLWAWPKVDDCWLGERNMPFSCTFVKHAVFGMFLTLTRVPGAYKALSYSSSSYIISMIFW